MYALAFMIYIRFHACRQIVGFPQSPYTCSLILVNTM